MPIRTTDLEDAIRGWLLASSGMPGQNVVFAYENAINPKGTYFNIVPVQKATTTGLEPNRLDNGDGAITYIEDWVVTAAVHCYGKGAMGKLTKARSDLWLPKIYDHFNRPERRLAASASDIVFQPEQKAQRFEEHAQLEMTICFRDSFTDDVGWFESVDVEFEVDSDQIFETIE